MLRWRALAQLSFAFWTGGFENRCVWYEKALGPKRTWIFRRLVQLLFGILAIAVKITIIERWYGRNTT